MRREWKHWNSTIQLCVCVSGCLTSQSFWFSVLVLVTAYHLRSLGGDKCGAKEIATSSIAIIKKRPFQESLPSQWNTTSHLFFLILGSLKLLCKTLICEMFQSSDSNSLKRTSAPERKTPNSGSSGGSVETSATQKCDGEWSQDPHVY